MKTAQKTVYISFDDKEFLTEDECLYHEKEILADRLMNKYNIDYNLFLLESHYICTEKKEKMVASELYGRVLDIIDDIVHRTVDPGSEASKALMLLLKACYDGLNTHF